MIGDNIIAAALGASIATITTAVFYFIDRCLHTRSVKFAIEYEVEKICDLIEERNFLGVYSALCDKIENGSWQPYNTMFLNIRSNHFAVFDSLASELGRLDRDTAKQFISFYSSAKVFVDMTSESGGLSDENEEETQKSELLAVKALIIEILTQGSKISSKQYLKNFTASPSHVTNKDQ